MWDCATGNGQAAVELAKRFPEVLATDHSQAQLDLAAKRPNINYRLGEAGHSGLADESIDIITVAQALHWFFGENFWKEVLRVLKPGGLFVAWTYAQHWLDDESLTAVTDHYHNETLRDYWPERRKHPVNRYREIDLPFSPMHSPQLMMKVEHTLEAHIGYLRSWSGTQRYIDAHHDDPTHAVMLELATLWGDPDAKHTVHWPLTIKAGIKD